MRGGVVSYVMHGKKLPCSPLDERTSSFFLAQRFPTGLVDLLCGGYVLSLEGCCVCPLSVSLSRTQMIHTLSFARFLTQIKHI